MSDLDIQRDGAVQRIILNRPERHNALDPTLIDALHGALDAASADPDIRVLQLTGAGSSFCAGADIGWMRRMADYAPAENLADAQRLAGLFEKLANLPLPTIAIVNGPAYGGGIGLIAAADFAIAVPGAEFVLSEVKLGLIPAVISPHIIRAIGGRAAKGLFLSGRKFAAQEARELGLLSDVIGDDEIDEHVNTLTRQLLENAPQAMAAAKELVAFVADRPVDRAVIDGTIERIAMRRASAEGKEGLTAFLEKRRPYWRSGAD